MSAINQNTVQHRLDRIKHFLQSSAPLLLIIGDAKSGRSAYLALLIQQMRVSRFLIAFKATPQLKPKFILNKLSSHWSAKKVDRSQDLHAQLEQIVQSLIHHDQRALLLIDDADILSASMLEIISHLTRIQEGHAPYLHIVLAGSSLLSQRMHMLHHRSIPQLSLMPLPNQTHATQRITPPTNTPQRKYIWTSAFRQMMQSLSLPHETNHPPVKITNAKRKRAPESRKKKMRLIAYCGLILTGMAMWWYDAQNSPWPSQQIKTQLAQKSNHLLAKKPTIPFTQPITLAHNTKNTMIIIQAHKPDTKEKPLLIIKQNNFPKEKTLIAAIDKPVKLAAHPVDTGFTLQLLGSYHKKEINEFITHHHLANAHIIKTKYHQKNWFALAYGHYKTHEQASNARKKLPNDLKKLHPWIRKVTHTHRV